MLFFTLSSEFLQKEILFPSERSLHFLKSLSFLNSLRFSAHRDDVCTTKFLNNSAITFPISP